MSKQLQSGMKVRYLPQPEWGVGHLLALDDEQGLAMVSFPGRGDEPVMVSAKGKALERVFFKVGERALTIADEEVMVTGVEPGADGLVSYAVVVAGVGAANKSEAELRAAPPTSDLVSLWREGRFGDPRDYSLRAQALRLDDERRCDALGAMLASRVRVQPHQIGVVQRVLTSHRPRFILADEVGLGKTIEAGMIFNAMRLSGLAKRVLVVAPSHLTVQWLVEMGHKFNQRFTLLDGSRLRDDEEAIEREAREKGAKAKSKEKAQKIADKVKQRLAAEEDPWLTQHLAITSLELLARNEKHRNAAARPEAHWDLVIIDEAHHLKGDKAFAAASALAQNCYGLLLLTATPMQLDPDEYRRLLTLIDPETAPTAHQLEELFARQDKLAETVRALTNTKVTPKTLQALAQSFPNDAVLRDLIDDGDATAVLDHLAETYSLSDHLLRNRRAVVGGFASRRLVRHNVEVSAAEHAARAQVMAAAVDKGLRGAVLATLVRRLDSSVAALDRSLQNITALAEIAPEVRPLLATLPSEKKVDVFVDTLRGVWKDEPGAKVLVFTEARETLDMLQGRCNDLGYEALVYHGELSLVDRDRQVARFRDPEGPKLLICTEVGGEGRNFQFSHHLVHYDLPWSPAAIEQRIGRLDRIGQTKPIAIHVFDVPGTFSQTVLDLMDRAVGVFGETIGGLDAVLEDIESKLSELVLLPQAEREAFSAELARRIAAAREQARTGYDPLLDMRSFDRPGLEQLVAKANARLDVDDEELDDDDARDPVEKLRDALWVVARDLDERLEDTVVGLARKVGIQVDTDEQVDAFQTAFHFGYAVNIDALAGLNIQDERTDLGTFWRETANEQEEIEYFATGHPIVEALFGMLRDGPFGRLALAKASSRTMSQALGFELFFHVVPADPADTTPGARVPSRQLARFMPSMLIRVVLQAGRGGVLSESAELGRALAKAKLHPLKGEEADPYEAGFARMCEPAMQTATQAAQAKLVQMKAAAARAITDERDLRLDRLERALVHQRVAEEQRLRLMARTERAYQEVLDALQRVRLELDSALAVVIE